MSKLNSMSLDHTRSLRNVESIDIAIVCSRFNESITSALLKGCTERLFELGLQTSQIHISFVSGAVEIPILAQCLAKSGKFKAIITLGAVIRGETDHYDHVCRLVGEGCLRVSLDYHLPVIFGVLTTDNEAQALDRVGGQQGHKGAYCADAALETLAAMAEIS